LFTTLPKFNISWERSKLADPCDLVFILQPSNFHLVQKNMFFRRHKKDETRSLRRGENGHPHDPFHQINRGSHQFLDYAASEDGVASVVSSPAEFQPFSPKMAESIPMEGESVAIPPFISQRAFDFPVTSLASSSVPPPEIVTLAYDDDGGLFIPNEQSSPIKIPRKAFGAEYGRYDDVVVGRNADDNGAMGDVNEYSGSLALTGTSGDHATEGVIGKGNDLMTHEEEQLSAEIPSLEKGGSMAEVDAADVSCEVTSFPQKLTSDARSSKIPSLRVSKNSCEKTLKKDDTAASIAVSTLLAMFGQPQGEWSVSQLCYILQCCNGNVTDAIELILGWLDDAEKGGGPECLVNEMKAKEIYDMKRASTQAGEEKRSNEGGKRSEPTYDEGEALENEEGTHVLADRSNLPNDSATLEGDRDSVPRFSAIKASATNLQERKGKESSIGASIALFPQRDSDGERVGATTEVCNKSDHESNENLSLDEAPNENANIGTDSSDESLDNQSTRNSNAIHKQISSTGELEAGAEKNELEDNKGNSEKGTEGGKSRKDILLETAKEGRITTTNTSHESDNNGTRKERIVKEEKPNSLTSSQKQQTIGQIWRAQLLGLNNGPSDATPDKQKACKNESDAGEINEYERLCQNELGKDEEGSSENNREQNSRYDEDNESLMAKRESSSKGSGSMTNHSSLPSPPHSVTIARFTPKFKKVNSLRMAFVKEEGAAVKGNSDTEEKKYETFESGSNVLGGSPRGTAHKRWARLRGSLTEALYRESQELELANTRLELDQVRTEAVRAGRLHEPCRIDVERLMDENARMVREEVATKQKVEKATKERDSLREVIRKLLTENAELTARLDEIRAERDCARREQRKDQMIEKFRCGIVNMGDLPMLPLQRASTVGIIRDRSAIGSRPAVDIMKWSSWRG